MFILARLGVWEFTNLVWTALSHNFRTHKCIYVNGFTYNNTDIFDLCNLRGYDVKRDWLKIARTTYTQYASSSDGKVIILWSSKQCNYMKSYSLLRNYRRRLIGWRRCTTNNEMKAVFLVYYICSVDATGIMWRDECISCEGLSGLSVGLLFIMGTLIDALTLCRMVNATRRMCNRRHYRIYLIEIQCTISVRMTK